MRYALVNSSDVVVNVIELTDVNSYTPPAGLHLVAGRDWPPAPPPAPTLSSDEIARRAGFFSDANRAQWLTQLQTASRAQVETFVRSNINADSVISLATAQTCLKRIETALVIIADLIALDSRN